MDEECQYGMVWDQCCHDLLGGLAAPTSWPVAEGQAIDIFYDQGTDKATGVFDRSFYRGVVDKASAPSARGIQKLLARAIARCGVTLSWV